MGKMVPSRMMRHSEKRSEDDDGACAEARGVDQLAANSVTC